MSFLVAAGLTAASSLMSSYSANRKASQQAAYQNAADQRAFANQAAQTAYASEIEKLQIGDYNDQTVKDYGTMIENYNQQLILNRTAAGGAFAAEQWKLNEQFAKVAFTRNELGKELTAMLGEQAARGTGQSSSKSADRANLLNSVAEWGRSNYMLSKTLTSARTQTKYKFGAIAGKHYTADLNAYSKIQIPPRMRTPKTGGGPNLTSPIARSTAGGLSFADVGTAVLSGVTAGAQAEGWWKTP